MKRIGLLVLIFGLSACAGDKFSSQKLTVGGQTGLALQACAFSELKGFESDDFLAAVEVFERNCQILALKPEILQKSQIKIEPKAYMQVCKKFTQRKPQTNAEMRNFIRDNFKPYKVLFNLDSNGKFTSYYEAELKASKSKHGSYQFPIYGRPNDLVEINLKAFDKSLPDRRLTGRVENGKMIPYYTRAQIGRKGVDAPVILWGNDPVDIFLMQIQGSAVALLDDGSSVRIRYADNNGHNFVGIGSILLKKGLLKPGQASMDKIRDWLKANPNLAQANMDENPRFIFHGISDQQGPVGALGVPLTAGRSLAVDSKYIPLGSLLWLETSAPDKSPLNKLVAAQDIGGAIKGAVRGDYFWGHGEEALLSAGKMNSAGQYYILLPVKSEVRISE